jgi:hypothetical protein
MHQKERTKPRELKPTIKRLIFQEAIRQRNVPRELLANRLIKELEEGNEVPPSLETAKRYISKARNATNPIDKPWTLGACRDYPTFFPPTSLLTLMKAQQNAKTGVDLLTGARDPGLSIRECIWIVRLQRLIGHYFLHGQQESNQEFNILLNLARWYSTAERTSEIMGEQTFDSNDLDEALCSQNLEKLMIISAADKDPTLICNDDCDSCKYQPVLRGKLCQLRGLNDEDEWPEHHLIQKPPTQSKKKGDSHERLHHTTKR